LEDQDEGARKIIKRLKSTEIHFLLKKRYEIYKKKVSVTKRLYGGYIAQIKVQGQNKMKLEIFPDLTVLTFDFSPNLCAIHPIYTFVHQSKSFSKYYKIIQAH